MAILDEIGRKISRASQSAVQKTREMTETAKYNGIIAEEERNIDNFYYQIGKLYVATHQENYEPEFERIIGSIRESQKQIMECRQKIQELKGMVRCEKCGYEVPKDNAFCSNCGSPMPKNDNNNQNLIKCESCGSMVDKNMRFCTNCGVPMTGVASSKRCTNCQSELDEDSVFCVNCGTKVE